MTPQHTDTRLPTHRPPTHPGEMLLEEYLKPAEISIKAFGEWIGIHYPRMHEVATGKRPMTQDTAERVARATQTSVEYWLNLQLLYDLWHAEKKTPQAVKKIKPMPAFAKAG
jgi:addiction module HigA family antidote